MKCEECLPILEEYLDGELDEQQNETVAAHVAACLECECTFNVLVEEQEMYASYRREVEVTPALWQAVRARIETEQSAPAPPAFFARLRERINAALALPRLTPALAGSFALAALCVTAGVIWQAQHSAQLRPDREVAQVGTEQSVPTSAAQERRAPASDMEVKSDGAIAKLNSELTSDKGTAVAATVNAKTPEVVENRAVSSERSRPAAFVPASAGRTNNRPVAFNNDHAVTSEDALLEEKPLIVANASPSANAPLQSADEEEISRHIEKAQLLLRSFRNADSAAEPNAVAADVAYEKRLSRELLNENILLRRDAETDGNVPTERLLSTLEPFLLDISNLQDKPAKEDVRSIQERMRKKEIIAALQVY